MKDLLTKAQSYLPSDRVVFVQRAYEYAIQAHQGQFRLSGEPFVRHPVETAMYLADLKLDSATLAAALLHDVMEDCGVSYEEVKREFGEEVSSLVDGVTKLNRLDLLNVDNRDGLLQASEDSQNHAASLRKMLVAMAEDLRVVLIKLADRLHNMRTLKAHSVERRRTIAQETLDIYAPLAHRLGMWDIKWRLEDLAFQYLQPTEYRKISRLVTRKRQEREQYITSVSDELSRALKAESISAKVVGRAKHIYSIHKKMEAYAAQGKDFHEIYDLFALRILVSEKKDCYAALGVVHSSWIPIPGQFDDYIAMPKENIYQALHTTVMGPEGMSLEVQIRTHAMHQVSEYGIAAHWRYKEGRGQNTSFDRKMSWFRQLLEWQREVSGAEEFLENVKTDLFRDQVFVYTPKGDIKEMPAGSTPIDLAYRVHTELGHCCIGAKVNGKLVPLDCQLQNSDTVEIITSKVATGPSLDWLNPHAGYVRSATTRQRIRSWFRNQKRAANIQGGRELLNRELRRLNLNPSEEQLARIFRLENGDEFLAALGSGSITANQVVASMTKVHGEDSATEYSAISAGPASGVEVLGVGDLMTSLASCCSPLPGDNIVGRITRLRGIAVHRKDCVNVVPDEESHRLIPVKWSTAKDLHPVRLSIEALDRVGLLRDITTLLSAERVNIASVVTRESDNAITTIELTLFTTGVDQLSRLFAKLEEVHGAISVTRAITNHAKSSPKMADRL